MHHIVREDVKSVARNQIRKEDMVTKLARRRNYIHDAAGVPDPWLPKPTEGNNKRKAIPVLCMLLASIDPATAPER